MKLDWVTSPCGFSLHPPSNPIKTLVISVLRSSPDPPFSALSTRFHDLTSSSQPPLQGIGKATQGIVYLSLLGHRRVPKTDNLDGRLIITRRIPRFRGRARQSPHFY